VSAQSLRRIWSRAYEVSSCWATSPATARSSTRGPSWWTTPRSTTTGGSWEGATPVFASTSPIATAVV